MHCCMYLYTVSLQASLVLARLSAHSPEQMDADSLNQYLGWTIEQLSRNVHCSTVLNVLIHIFVCVLCATTHASI